MGIFPGSFDVKGEQQYLALANYSMYLNRCSLIFTSVGRFHGLVIVNRIEKKIPLTPLYVWEMQEDHWPSKLDRTHRRGTLNTFFLIWRLFLIYHMNVTILTGNPECVGPNCWLCSCEYIKIWLKHTEYHCLFINKKDSCQWRVLI